MSGKPPVICSLIDAKNDNVYFELYSVSFDGLPTAEVPNKSRNIGFPLPIIQASCVNINELISILKDYDNICFVGDGAVSHKSILASSLNNSTFSKYNEISSFSLGIAGLNASSCRNYDLLPVYLRKSQAERAKEEASNDK